MSGFENTLHRRPDILFIIVTCTNNIPHINKYTEQTKYPALWAYKSP